jgi:hypothetical protein
MCRSHLAVPQFRPDLRVVMAFLLGALGPTTGEAQDRSPVVLNCDGGGTTLVKDFAGSSFQVQQLWTSNQTNGIQAFDDGTFAFLNCSPTLRTQEEVTLSCSIFDQALGRWGESPVVTTVGLDFLDGDFANPFNSLFEWTGEYLTVFDVGTESYSFRMLFLDAFQTEDGFPILLGQTNPQSRAFMLRNVDVPGGTTNTTNVSVGMQFDDLCVDLDLNPTAPGATLVGTLGARVLNQDGSCGNLIVENRFAALTPSGGSGRAGSECSYIETDPIDCEPDGGFERDTIFCLPCTGTCRDFSERVTIAVPSGSGGYRFCRDIIFNRLDEGCSNRCIGVKAIVVTTGADPAAARAAFAARK